MKILDTGRLQFPADFGSVPLNTIPKLNPARENELVMREIQEIGEAWEAFKAAVQAGEMTGFRDGG